MADQVQGNDPAAREPTGELKSGAPTTEPTAQTTEATTTTSAATGTPTEPKATEPADDTAKALLNKDAPKAPVVPEGAPEKYEAFKVPDGFEMPESVSKEAGDLFKGLNLSQAQAQSLVDFYAAKQAEALEAPYKLMDEMRQTWQREVLSDAKLGNGTELKPEVKQAVSSLIDAMGPEAAKAFREAMDLTGVGDHPAFVRGIFALGQKYGEGKLVVGNGPSVEGQRAPNAGPRSAASAIFPNLPSATAQR